MLIGLLDAYVPAYTDRQACWTLDGDLMRWLGVGLFAAGGALRIWPVFVLGHRFSGLVTIQPGHTLVTSGVYGIIYLKTPTYKTCDTTGMDTSRAHRACARRSGSGRYGSRA